MPSQDRMPPESPASRGRGLKPLASSAITVALVARFTRAWIETNPAAVRRDPGVARFTRAWIETSASLMCRIDRHVARFTRAWIETESCSDEPDWPVARFTRAWIETADRAATARSRGRRPLHAGVD